MCSFDNAEAHLLMVQQEAWKSRTVVVSKLQPMAKAMLDTSRALLMIGHTPTHP